MNKPRLTPAEISAPAPTVRLARIAELAADRAADLRGDRAAGYPARSFAAIAATVELEHDDKELI